MNAKWIVAVALAILSTTSSAVWAQTDPELAAAAQKSAISAPVRQVEATIVGKDASKRTLMLRGEKGVTVPMVVGSEVQNFNRLKIGDHVKVALRNQCHPFHTRTKPTSTSATQATQGFRLQGRHVAILKLIGLTQECADPERGESDAGRQGNQKTCRNRSNQPRRGMPQVLALCGRSRLPRRYRASITRIKRSHCAARDRPKLSIYRRKWPPIISGRETPFTPCPFPPPPYK
jgi:hypothetical protein